MIVISSAVNNLGNCFTVTILLLQRLAQNTSWFFYDPKCPIFIDIGDREIPRSRNVVDVSLVDLASIDTLAGYNVITTTINGVCRTVMVPVTLEVKRNFHGEELTSKGGVFTRPVPEYVKTVPGDVVDIDGCSTTQSVHSPSLVMEKYRDPIMLYM